MLQNRNLSVNDKKRLLLLATKEIEQENKITSVASSGEEQKNETKEDTKNSRTAIHAPKDTAAFLSLFNDPNGFKFLTHDFDPDSDMNYEKLMVQVRDTFKKESSSLKIPPTLWTQMNAFINGGKGKDGKERTWRDSDGVFHTSSYGSKEWMDWATNNPNTHLLSNEGIGREILKFRSSIRIIKPTLHDIVDDIVADMKKRCPNLVIQTSGLENADFYTHVWSLRDGIRRILEDMSRYAEKTPNVKISFERRFGDDYSKKIIKITQIESVSYSLDEVLRKFYDKEKKGGSFNGIKGNLYGYCNWSVESLWDGKSKRWNILKDSNIDEIEDLGDTNIPGFTHILTYFSK